MRLGYIFQAAVYCDKCITDAVDDAGIDPGNFLSRVEEHGDVETALFLLSWVVDVNYQDEETYDSDDFPKWYTRMDAMRDEEPVFCGSCGDVLWPELLSESVPVLDPPSHIDEYPRCPRCNEPIDYCQGHGEIAHGYATIEVTALALVMLTVMFLSGLIKDWNDWLAVIVFTPCIIWAVTR